MKIKDSPLGFKIPETESGKKPIIDVSAKSILEWRASLPLADMGTSTKQMYSLLTDLNHCEISCEDRFNALELIRPAIQLMGQSLLKHYITHNPNLTEKQLTIAKLSETLHLQLCMGYKLVLNDLVEQGKAKKDDTLAVSIFNILHHYILIFLHNYQLYTDVPIHIWQEMHSLYRLAVKYKVAEIKLGDTPSNPDGKRIICCYKDILLLAATNPYKWRQKDLELIYETLEYWAQHVTIVPYSSSKHDKKAGYYIFDPKKDKGPYSLLCDGIEKNDGCLVLDLHKLNKRMQSILTAFSVNELKTRKEHDNEPEYRVPSSTLQGIYDEWNSCKKQKNKRFNASGKIKVTLGLKNTHYYLSKMKDFDAKKIEDAAIKQSGKKRLVKEEKKDKSEDNEGLSLDGNLPTLDFADDEDSGISLKNDSDSEEIDNKGYKTYECDLIDLSPTGNCISWDCKQDALIEVGSIVGLNSGDVVEPDNWSIGVIRWQRKCEKGKFRTGIELLAPNAIAAGAQILDFGKPIGQYMRCLVLPSIPDLKKKSLILTPVLPFYPDKEINVYEVLHEKLFDTKLLKMIDVTPNYKLFSYRFSEKISDEDFTKKAKEELLKKEKKLEDEMQGDSDNDQFSDIWDKI